MTDRAPPSGYSWANPQPGPVPCKPCSAEGAGGHPQTGAAAGESPPRHPETHQHGRHPAAVCGKTGLIPQLCNKLSVLLGAVQFSSFPFIVAMKSKWFRPRLALQAGTYGSVGTNEVFVLSGGSSNGGDCGGLHRSASYPSQRPPQQSGHQRTQHHPTVCAGTSEACIQTWS